MKEAATLVFKDFDSGRQAVVIVRYDGDRVGLCISRETDGDVEVFLDKRHALMLLTALKRAVE